MEPRILVVDDDTDISDLVRSLLEGEGYAVAVETDLSADSIESAVRRLEPDCILLDGHTPARYGDSWDKATWIAGRTQRIPVIMFTSHGPDADEARAGESQRSRSADLFAIVEKPIDADVLLETVRRAIDARASYTTITSMEGPLLATLERLIALPADNLKQALEHAVQLLVDVFRADKVDAWLPDFETDELVAVGVSDTPTGREQIKHNLDHFSLTEPWRVIDIFHTGEPYLTGRADLDGKVHPGVRDVLGIRSMLGVPLDVAGERRGVLLIASQQPDRYTGEDLRFLGTVAGWVGMVAHRGELAEQQAQQEAERRALEEAKAERARLNRLFEQSPTIVALLSGPEHVFTLANPLYLQLVDREDVLGKPAREALPELEDQTYFEVLDNVYRTGVPATGREQPIRLRRAGQLTTAYVDFVFQPIFDPSGAVEGIFVQGVDVTQQVEARQRVETLVGQLADQRDRLELAQEAGRIGTFDWDIATGRITWTDELEALYGLPPGSFGGGYEDWTKHVHPDDRERAEHDLREAVEAGRDFNSQFRVIWPDGDIRYLAAYGRLVHDASGTPVRMVGVNVDISDRERALEAAQQAIKARDEFLSIASHELRNPLAGLTGMAQMLGRLVNREQPDLERLRRSVTNLQTSANRLVRLVDDLLDVSRLRTGQLHLRLEETDLTSLIREAVEQIQVLAPERHIVLNEGCQAEPCTVHADPDRLSQVVTNLLENAVKYSPDDRDIFVRLRKEPDGVRLEVEDQGIGLPQGQEESIFHPFGRATNAEARNIPGMGLGLYVSRQIVEAHGGELRAESRGEGMGTTFSLCLPNVPDQTPGNTLTTSGTAASSSQ